VGAGANFQNTTFDDAASTLISAGASPFAGSYRPQQPLSVLTGKNAQGTWRLAVFDWGRDSGTVNSWSLTIQPAAGPSTHLAAAEVNTMIAPSLLTSPAPTGTPPIPVDFNSSSGMMDVGKPASSLVADGPVTDKVAIGRESAMDEEPKKVSNEEYRMLLQLETSLLVWLRPAKVC
jgi:hypothetical protein